ncbi:ParB/RepB/Spo0J family partition protein [Pantoea agglomerans]|uniref:ParB/RepB/Spo0J family partition protein n=1 Tax=Enterobacter agglomerans TaxID=549 RepID=A0ACC5PW39_ENTAG|nr:ParB/RepB/Spo0J family partition protein [Pantoea agglomerans]MBD8129320.1 ParB/RepB/Spo0J family partition protein [Pantoea agglomerans]MBD8234675.1 ParB/RepB/Spo0J family partition protein [Pantoea agglomerans]MBD8244988.1 ParB/RepB/Spo0J family partition protein [Pantoea agglomerans]WVL83625.1 ParB/RepB/Spo0J family partition protein [Pantoea agglomerans]
MSQQNVNTTASESKESSTPKPRTPRRPAKAKADKAAVAAVEQALEKIDIEMIPLSRLAVSPLNVRSKVYVQSRIESLAATIKNVGLLHNLIAHDMADGMLGVACGGRRLTALQLLLSQGVYQPDQLIPVKRVTEELARAASMVENGEREDMHPAEQIAGFRALADEGKTPAQIGDLMGYSSRHVQRCLKLTDLAPAILDELAADNITLEQCQALALADTHERQLEVWEQASGYYNASAETIRKLITSSETAISHSPKFAFIGKDVYLAAGGSIRADLFSNEDEGYIDTALVEQLTLDKLQKIADAVQKEEGFAWAEVRMDSRLQSWSSEVKKTYQLLPERCPELTPEEDAELSDLRAQLRLSEDDSLNEQLIKQIAALEETGLKRSWSGADKDKTGVVIYFERGNCFIQRGVQRQADLPKKMKPENKNDLQNLSEDYSASLVRSMSCDRSLAVQAALSTKPDIAVAMLTWTLCRATFSHRSYEGTPMKISLTDNSSALISDSSAKEDGKAWQFLQQQKAEWQALLPKGWEQDFRWLLDWSTDDVLGLQGFCSATAVCCFQDRMYGKSQTSNLDALELAMGFDLADWWQPTAEGFFKRISKEQIAGVLTEVGKTGNASDAEKMKKGDAADFAESSMKNSRWVPSWMKPLQSPATGTSHDADSEA